MSDNRNILDVYKYWTTEAIKANLDLKRHNFSILISNKFNDFNIGQVIRNSNAFLAKEVYIYGRKQYDRRATVGTHIYENLHFIKTIEELKFDRPIIGVDNIPNAKPIEDYEYPDNPIFAFGQEDVGLPKEFLDICADLVYIRQYGSVRSLNVGCASAIIMYDWVQKNAKL